MDGNEIGNNTRSEQGKSVEFCVHWISAKDKETLSHGHSVSARGVGINLHSHTKLRQEDGAVSTQQVQGKIQKNQGKLLEHMGNHV